LVDAVTKFHKICVALGTTFFIGLAVAGLLYALGTEDRGCREKGGRALTEKIPTRKELLTRQGVTHYDTFTLMKWCMGADGKRLPE
jgi:hypothetical protein